MRRPSIKFSLIGIFMSFACAFGGYVALSVSGLSQLYTSSRAVSEDWLGRVSAIDDIRAGFIQQRLGIARHILSNSADAAAEQQKSLEATDEFVDKSIDSFSAFIKGGSETAILKDLVTLNDEYDPVAKAVIDLSQQNKKAEATALFNDKLSPIGEKMTSIIDKFAKTSDDGAATSSSEVSNVYARIVRVTVIATGAMGLLLLMGIVFVLRSITRPITRITMSMRNLASGDVETGIPYAGRADEIGSMAAAIEIFRKSAVHNKNLEAAAASARVESDEARTRDRLKAEGDAAERLQLATAGLATGLRQLASGNLSCHLTETFSPEFESLRHDFNSSVKQLGETLQTIAQSVSTMTDGANEIASGANDLSRRTEQQAASLEETAAALEEITANVSNSAKRTEDARNVANIANNGAAHSLGVVTKAKSAMERIEASSSQISSIIGVIDEIAFQTNLLALNAGVEAARAGEAGRGFAVVAQEVRELAQRSAKAAKEIKGLIQASTKEVEDGVCLVRDTGDAIEQISRHITEINGHMEAIASSTREQSTGLAEVNTAVNSLDQTTQQNAAMVEQSTAASSTLALEAAKLAETVGQFTLVSNPASNVLHLRETAKTMGTRAAGLKRR